MVRWLEGKVALVTGGSSGIGRASAVAFARDGARVIIADVDVKGGKETMRMIDEGGGEAIFVRADVTKAAEVEALIYKVIETYGQLHYAFNNAGVEAHRAPTADCTEEDWDRIINVNLRGVWLCMKYEIPQIVRSGGGAIVNTSSTAGLRASPNIAPYVASKHGVVGLTKCAALEYAKVGVRINAICPGAIETPMLERLVARGRKLTLGPMGRKGGPEEVAEAVVWLCSNAASFVTGHTLAVDGGSLAR